MSSKKPEIQRIIDEAGAKMAASMGMPEARTTTVEKEFNTADKIKKTYHVKFFAILDDESAAVYSDFMTKLINSSGTQIVREDKSWTQEGELLRVVDYIEDVAE